MNHNATVLLQLDSIYNAFINVANIRYQSGDIGKIDVSIANTKKGEINLLYLQNETVRQNTYQNLKFLMQVNTDFEIATQTIYQPLFLTDYLDTSAITHHPSLQALYQEAIYAESSIKVMKASNLPDFTLSYSNISLIGNLNRNGIDQFYGRSQRFSYVDFGVSIPIFTKNKASIQALDYQKMSVLTKAEGVKAQLQTALQNALNNYAQSIKQYQYFVQQALPNATEIIKAGQLGYRTGEINYVQYLYALQTATDILLNYLKSIQQVNEAVTQIYSLINK